MENENKNEMNQLMAENQMIAGIQKVIADLNKDINFRIQLTHNINWMLILDAIQRTDKNNPKLQKICDYLRMVENLKTFHLIQKSMRGYDLLLLLGESAGSKIDMTALVKELLFDKKTTQ